MYLLAQVEFKPVASTSNDLQFSVEVCILNFYILDFLCSK